MKINVEINSKGYLRLRTYIENQFGNKQQTTKALEIRLDRKSDFLKTTQKISSKNADYKEINNKIEQAKQEWIAELNNRIEIKKVVDSKENFLEFYNIFVESKENYATKNSLISVKKIFTDFLSVKNISVLACSRFNEQLILEYRDYLINTKSKANRTRTAHTAQKYLADLKAVVNYIIKTRKFNWVEHPFKFIETIKYNNTYKNRMQKTDFVNLLNFEDYRSEYIEENTVFCSLSRIRKLDSEFNNLLRYRDMFVFSVFGNGMRVSDLLALKFSNFQFLDDNKFTLDYISSKTLTHMNINISINILKYLETHIINIMKKYLDSKFNSVWLLDYTELKKLESEIKKTKFENDDDFENATIEIRDKINDCLYKLLKLVSTNSKTANKLIFSNCLKFDNVRDYNLPFEKYDVYKKTKEQRKTILCLNTRYNRKIKEVAISLNIDCNLSSHIARHQFATFLLASGANIQQVKTSLAHTNLAITDSYIKSLESNYAVTKETADKFDKQFFQIKKPKFEKE